MDRHVRVLLIEDSRTDTEMVTGILAHATDVTFEVATAGSLADGLEQLTADPPDAVVLDLHLPDSAGLATFTAAVARAPDLPIVVVTGSDDESLGVAAVEQGAQDYLVKWRVDPNLLTRTILYAIERHRVLATLQERVADEGDSRARLAATNETMREFVAMVSHEIRAPLAVIRGLAEMLFERGEALSEDRRHRSLEGIVRQSQRLSRLTDDLLTTARIDAGVVIAHPQAVDIAEAIEQAVIDAHDEAEGVEVDAPEGLTGWVDPDHLAQVLVNFLTNARKYGQAPVVVAARLAQGAVEIKVCDSGSGVQPEFVPQLFSRFARFESDAARGVPGTGLGLSIVDGLARANGGAVWYEPNEPHGSRFCLRVPAHQP